MAQPGVSVPQCSVPWKKCNNLAVDSQPLHYRYTMAEQKASCPYAVSLAGSSDEDESGSQVDNLLEVAMTSCPAFESGSCPFKDAKNADQVRHALLEVPPSHLEEKGHFYRALRHLHKISQTLELDDKFTMSGGCPVSSYSPDASFAAAMEEYSLASIMARMAQDLMDKDEGDADDKVSMEASAVTSKVGLKQKAQVSSSTPDVESSHQVRLSEALKSGTAASHQAAEDVHFVKNFIKGIIDRELYAELVLSLYHVYSALEEALNQHAPKYFRTCHFPTELSRKEALQEDVDFWHGTLPNRISPATRDYVDRIQYLAKTDPLLLLAHAYTRYLGDLSGGKILARVARRAMQLESDGLDFYKFEYISSAKLFKDQYRRALDDLCLTPTQVSKLVVEANIAFVLNMRLFEELDVMANIEGAQVRDLHEALNFANATSSSSEAGARKEECPFAKIGGGINPHKIAAARMKVPWPFVVGLVLCGVWFGVQKYWGANAQEPKQDSLVHAVLEPFQEWDARSPWM